MQKGCENREDLLKGWIHLEWGPQEWSLVKKIWNRWDTSSLKSETQSQQSFLALKIKGEQKNKSNTIDTQQEYLPAGTSFSRVQSGRFYLEGKALAA